MTAATGRHRTLAARIEAGLSRHWWQPRPTLLARLLWPLSQLYLGLAALHRSLSGRPQSAPVPLLVVGNLVVGGAGKTPTVLALASAFRAAGRRPGVISRGYGRSGDGPREVGVEDDPARVGDEPLLIRRRSGLPVWVGGDRLAAARGLCARHPEVDLLLADDGLQHHALAGDAELVVFDERGAGNGLPLPAGPLRQPLPERLAAHARVLYTAGDYPSTALPGKMAVRRIESAWPLQAWQRGDSAEAIALSALRGRPLLAAAGLAAPERFFAALEAKGLTIERLPMPDHHPYDTLPWPAHTPEVITTEKDAIKLEPASVGRTRVWVVPLDLQLPAGLAEELLALLPLHPAARTPP